MLRSIIRDAKVFGIIVLACVIGTIFIVCVGEYDIPKKKHVHFYAKPIRKKATSNSYLNKAMPKEPNISFKYPKSTKTINILLNGYHRSGSSFTGNLLASHPNTFYFFEPLIKIGGWGHFIKDNQLCNDLTNVCRKLNATSKELESLRGYMKSHNVTETESFMEILYHVLLGIYNCQLNDLDNLIIESVMGKYTENTWQNFYKCRWNGNPKLGCLPLLISECKESRVRLIKLVRLRLDIAAPLLERDPAFKLVHLFRDPRGILSSRLVKTGWYPLHIKYENYEQVLKHTQLLCSRMLIDFEAGKKLMQLFPKRVKFIRYEDLLSDRDDSMKNELYQFLGLSFSTYSKPTNENRLNDWTTMLGEKAIQMIDSACSVVYERLGYVQFDFNALRNKTSIRTFKPKSFGTLR